MDKAFLVLLKYVWHFDRVNRPASEARRMAIAPQIPVVHLSGSRQISVFVAGLNKSAPGHRIDSDIVTGEAE